VLPKLAFRPVSSKLAALKNLVGQVIRHSRNLIAIAAGLVLASAFLEFGLAGLAWIGPALMVTAASGENGRAAFRIGYVAGLAFHLAALHWLLFIPVKGYPILGWVALSAFLALYPATWVWLVTGLQPMATEPIPLAWFARFAWTLSGAAIWVALEVIQARLFSGFPWNLLGASQYQMLPLIQIASVTGVYGVSFLVTCLSLSLYLAVLAILRRPTNRNAWLGEIILPLTVLLALFVFGLGRLRDQDGDRPRLRVTFVQPSIPQTMIWDEKENDNRFRQLLDLTERALAGGDDGENLTNPLRSPSLSSIRNGGEGRGAEALEFMDRGHSNKSNETAITRTDLLLWPEAAVPKMIRYDEETFRAITGLARSNRVWIIIGCDDAERRLNSDNPDEADFFNGSFLITPNGEAKGVYHKRHLVMFGEYIPLIRWLPFVKWFTPITGGFTPGNRIVPFELDVGVQASAWPDDTLKHGLQRVKTATLICFEDVFPHLVREYVQDDTDFLVNLTNDGWFGEGVEQWQHAAAAVFRAVENGLPLARSCNNGLTCWIDACGRLRDILRDKNGRIYGVGTMTVEIPVLAPGGNRVPTFYNKHGDWFGWGCVVLTMILLAARLAKPSR